MKPVQICKNKFHIYTRRNLIRSVALVFLWALYACSYESIANFPPPKKPSTETTQYNDSIIDQVRDLYKNNPDKALATQFTFNEAAYIPAQCYTKTKNKKGNTFNPCYTCHINTQPPNYINDEALQQEFSFQSYALKNRWHNLFTDRSEQVNAISDEDIESYIEKSNYFDEKRRLVLALKLQPPPKAWDIDGDGNWSGYIPDAHFNFDNEGFDHAPDGQYTGWRSFAYYPLPGNFMPTNGSTDDVLIRLPMTFQQTETGEFSSHIYSVNLAIVESLIKQKSIFIPPTSENALGVDLNQNQTLDTATQVSFNHEALNNGKMTYVGMAKAKQAEGEIKIAAGLYPLGTEFLHSVRYIRFNEHNHVELSPRLKELRYAIKKDWFTYSEHEAAVLEELRERQAFPDRLKTVYGNSEQGVSNNQGWIYQGFIEDQQGELRPQTFEEHLFCVGCHSTIGRITDGSFALPRKLSYKHPPNLEASTTTANTAQIDHQIFQSGWYHWSQKSLRGVEDPKLDNGETEYAFYLKTSGTGDEFRSNAEIQAKFFTKPGILKKETLSQLRSDISTLLWPSKSRGIALNKAYKVLVTEQSYIFGRQALTVPAIQLHEDISPNSLTGIKNPVKLNAFKD